MKKQILITTCLTLSLLLLSFSQVSAANCDKLESFTGSKGTATTYVFTGKISNCATSDGLDLFAQKGKETINRVAFKTDANGLFKIENVTFPSNGKWDVVVMVGSTVLNASNLLTVDVGAEEQKKLSCGDKTQTANDPACPANCPATLTGSLWVCQDPTLIPIAGGSGSMQSSSVKIVLRPKPGIKDTYIVNQAYANTDGSANTSITGGTSNTPINSGATDFESLVSGQGRNTGILGGESQFVEAIKKNGAKRLQSGDYTAELTSIYQKSIARQVNPVLLVSMWGVEQGFTHGTAFGCGIYVGGARDFDSQLTCAVNTIDNWMKNFDQRKAQGTFPVTIADDNGGKTCSYTDPFVYAYEMYTPDCHFSDGNGNARKNFAIIMREMLGL